MPQKVTSLDDEATRFGVRGFAEESDFSTRLKKVLEDSTLDAVKVIMHLVVGFAIFVVVLVFIFAEGWLKRKLDIGQGPSGQSQSFAGLEHVATTEINLREGPGANTNKIGLCEKGSRVRVVGTSVNGSTTWYEIELLSQPQKEPNSQRHGWIAARYVTQLRQ